MESNASSGSGEEEEIETNRWWKEGKFGGKARCCFLFPFFFSIFYVPFDETRELGILTRDDAKIVLKVIIRSVTMGNFTAVGAAA